MTSRFRPPISPKHCSNMMGTLGEQWSGTSSCLGEDNNLLIEATVLHSLWWLRYVSRVGPFPTLSTPGQDWRNESGGFVLTYLVKNFASVWPRYVPPIFFVWARQIKTVSGWRRLCTSFRIEVSGANALYFVYRTCVPYKHGTKTGKSLRAVLGENKKFSFLLLYFPCIG